MLCWFIAKRLICQGKGTYPPLLVGRDTLYRQLARYYSTECGPKQVFGGTLLPMKLPHLMLGAFISKSQLRLILPSTNKQKENVIFLCREFIIIQVSAPVRSGCTHKKSPLLVKGALSAKESYLLVTNTPGPMVELKEMLFT